MTYPEAVAFLNHPATLGYIPIDWPTATGPADEETKAYRREMHAMLDEARAKLIEFAFVDHVDHVVHGWAPLPDYPQAAGHRNGMRVTPVTLGEGIRWQWYGPGTGSTASSHRRMFDAIKSAEAYTS